MSFVSVMVVDPEPMEHTDDVIVFQVPENSRALALLIELLNNSGIEHTMARHEHAATSKEKGIQQTGSQHQIVQDVLGGRS